MRVGLGEGVWRSLAWHTACLACSLPALSIARAPDRLGGCVDLQQGCAQVDRTRLDCDQPEEEVRRSRGLRRQGAPPGRLRTRCVARRRLAPEHADLARQGSSSCSPCLHASWCKGESGDRAQARMSLVLAPACPPSLRGMRVRGHGKTRLVLELTRRDWCCLACVGAWPVLGAERGTGVSRQEAGGRHAGQCPRVCRMRAMHCARQWEEALTRMAICR